jgi:hypothetical protein
MRFLGTLLFSGLLAAGCATQHGFEQIMQSWNNKDIDECISQ